MNTFRRAIAAVSGLALLLAMTAFVGEAEATHIGCGTVITQNTVLDSDVGPCPGDGLIVRGSNIVLDLNGKRIFAANGAGDNAGIRLAGVTGVIVRNGTVQGFDAGILIVGGGGNVVQRVTARDNINDGLGPPCDLGDGIAILNSDNNRVEGSNIVHNGPFGGVSLIEDSDGNHIRGNQVLDNNVVGRPRSGCGNLNQDEGIRIEGPGANNNRVEGNNVQRSLLAGVGLHGHVCNPGPNEELEQPNTDNVVIGNTIAFTAGTPIAAGINVLAQGPLGTVTCAAFRNSFIGNTSSNNQAEGIYIAPTSVNNTINGNTVNQNGTDGILLDGPVIQNRFTNVGPTLFDVVQPDRPPYAEGTDYRVMPGSGSGDVTGRLVPIDIKIGGTGDTNTNPADTSTSGCEQADYDAAGFRPGDIALIQRGTCTFVSKVNLAIANGASAVIMFNEGQAGRTTAIFGSVGPVPIPVLSASFAVGRELYNMTQAGTVTVRVVTNTRNERVQVAPGAENNTLIQNKGRGNAEHDGHDENPNCDNNRWQGNEFVTVNQPCVASGGTGSVPGPGAQATSAQPPRDHTVDVGRGGSEQTSATPSS